MNSALFLTTVAIWGSTWIAIKFQLGIVEPEISIVYRFGLAAAVSLLFCRIKGISLKFSTRDHLWIGLQGVFLFSVNYVFVYVAAEALTSGLLAIVFSSIIIFNILLKRIFLKTRIAKTVVVSAVLGILGTVFVFSNQIQEPESLKALALAFIGTIISSMGNILSALNQRRGLPVPPTNAIGMAYGALVLAVVAASGGASFTFDTRVTYVASLTYLALFGSVIAFWTYLTLLGRVGPDRAAYAMIVFPMVALGISTVVEGYEWGNLSIVGTILILAGNAVNVSDWWKSNREEKEKRK